MTRNVQKTLGIRVALAAAVAFPLIIAMSARAQEPAPPPQTGTNVAPAAGAPAATEATAERVIVTGSNIPTAEEVGPNPVDTYRRDDITRLGVRTPTDLVLRLPAATGSNTTENNTNGGDGTTRISLRGIDPKETLVLQDGRRLANAGAQSVDFNRFPLGLIDHIDILKDGASPIYGTEAVAGVVNVFLIHRFRGLEVYASYGNTTPATATPTLVSPTIAVKKPATCSQAPGTTRQTSWFSQGFTTRRPFTRAMPRFRTTRIRTCLADLTAAAAIFPDASLTGSSLGTRSNLSSLFLVV